MPFAAPPPWRSPTSGSRRGCARRPRSCAPRAPGSWRRATPSGGGWSATCTTAPSSGWSRWLWPCAWPARLLGEPEQAARLLDDAGRELGEALAELRELARGNHPAVLTDQGLRVALESVLCLHPGGYPSTSVCGLEGRPAPGGGGRGLLRGGGGAHQRRRLGPLDRTLRLTFACPWLLRHRPCHARGVGISWPFRRRRPCCRPSRQRILSGDSTLHHRRPRREKPAMVLGFPVGQPGLTMASPRPPIQARHFAMCSVPASRLSNVGSP